jgi:hypothetical protein
MNEWSFIAVSLYSFLGVHKEKFPSLFTGLLLLSGITAQNFVAT